MDSVYKAGLDNIKVMTGSKDKKTDPRRRFRIESRARKRGSFAFGHAAATKAVAGVCDTRYARLMTNDAPSFEIFLISVPGFEPNGAREALAAGFSTAKVVKGGVTVRGGWREVWRANLEIRGASRVVARIAQFRALHLAQLDKRSRKVAWGEALRRDRPFRVEATCKTSRIYHSGAAAQRVERAINEEARRAGRRRGGVHPRSLRGRHVHDRRRYVGRAAAQARPQGGGCEGADARDDGGAASAQCGYDGREPVLDPMCGSGTFVIEAAEIAAGLMPGRSRHFAFEHLATLRPGRVGADARRIRANRNERAVLRQRGSPRRHPHEAMRSGVAASTAFESKRRTTDGDPAVLQASALTRHRDRRRQGPLQGSTGSAG